MDDASAQFSVENQLIDQSKLSEDSGDVYLFQWLSSVEIFLKNASSDDLKAVQRSLETTLTLIITKGSPYPAPGKAIRNVVSSCFVLLFTLGESRAVFETLLACLRVLGDFKAPADRDLYKVAASFCIGEIMVSSLGGQVCRYGLRLNSFMNFLKLTSFMVDIATVALKTHKSSSSVLLRYHVLITLRKTLTTARRAATDNVMKDILKQMRGALLDKSLPIRRAAADVLYILYPLTGAEWTVAEIEQIVLICVKSFDGADQATRRPLANLVGKVLASSQQQAIALIENKKREKEDENEDAGSPSVAQGLTKPILTLDEMFQQLSAPFNKPNAVHKTRIGLFDCYVSLLSALGPSFVESHYGDIVQHFTNDIVSSLRNPSNRFETLLVRKLVGIILRDLIGVRMLGEQAQIGAIQELSSAYLKRWPALMPGQNAPSPDVLAIVLREVAGLLQQLGNAPPPDSLAEPLVTLLSHPSHTVRVYAASALRIFCYSTPLRLPKILIDVIELLHRDITMLTVANAPPELSSRAIGHAYGLAALVTVIPSRPLYASYDISAKVLDMAIQLLKRSGDHDVKLSQVEIEIAWACVASLMTLGPNFVRTHLPQLLVLWRNALPKPTGKDMALDSGRTLSEWSFLLRVREAALGAIYCFLRYNSPVLLTLDVARRIATMLNNAFTFVSAISPILEDPNGQNVELSQIRAPIRSRESLLKRRIFQCFTVLGSSSVPEVTQTALLQTTVSLFATPEGFVGSSMQAAIASSSGLFTSLWQTFDNYAYGVTSTTIGEDAVMTDPSEESVAGWNPLNRDSVEFAIDDLLRQPILQSCEHDPLSLCQSLDLATDVMWPEFPPAASQAIDAGLNLFACLFPAQNVPTAVKVVSALMDALRSPKFEKNIGRKAACRVNAAISIVLALRRAMNDPSRNSRDIFANSVVSSTVSSFLKADNDDVLRAASSEALGRLANISDSQQFLAGIMKTLVDQVVNNRDPQGRAGCSLALGAIYDHVGSLAAGPLLKTTVNILMSLSKDAHPVVHFWALHSLARVVNAASLAYAPYVPATLYMLFKIYVSPSHELEGGSIAISNSSGGLPALQVACKIIDATITVLGPDIQDTWRTRTLILDLVHRLIVEDDEGIRIEAIKCIQHFLLFGPDHVSIPDLIAQFRLHLKSSRRPLKLASIHALYQLIQRDAVLISKIGGDSLVRELFAMLDGDPSIEGVRKVIMSWLRQTVVYNPSAWIDLCQAIMSRTTASQRVVEASKGDSQAFDDEGASLSIGTAQDGETTGSGNLTSRWRTQLFALHCLHELCIIIANSGRREQLDIAYARKLGVPVQGLLVSRVSDMIKMAFTASTAYVTEIRLEGLIVLRDVIEIFAKTPDPDYEEALLMEQYQAPITAALTPAFTSDSTPEILASAIGACAVFVGCGVVKDVGRMGRILRLLTSALEQCKGSKMFALGEASEGSPNASAMLRIATLSAWAELASASIAQSYLSEVINPYRADLAKLWLAALRDYASIRAGSEAVQDSSSAALDPAYVSLGRDILLPYYADTWPVILQAVAIFMERHDSFIRAAMDGLDALPEESVDAMSRDEPTALFFVVFGLVYETLSGTYFESSESTRGNISQVVLRAMKSLVRKEYAGNALLEPTILEELLGLWYRMAMTEPPAVQIRLVEAIAAFASGQGSTLDQQGSDSLQMHCLRICAYILKTTIPGSRVTSGHILSNPVDRVNLIKAAFDAFIAIGATFGMRALEEIRATAISLYCELLKSEAFELDFVGPTLPTLKQLITLPPGQEASPYFSRVIHGLLSACLLNVDDMKGRQGVISSNKSKNNLLTAALVLTGAPSNTNVSDTVLSHLCLLVSEKLTGANDMALTAAHCVKTLFAAATGNALFRQCIRRLLPGTVEYVATAAVLSEDRFQMHAHLPAIEELLKAFGILFSGVAEEHRSRLMGILLPSLTTLLDIRSPSSPLYTQVVGQLLNFASLSPAAFKEAALRLEQTARDRMESALREALASRAPTAAHPSKPQISLRSF
ncbi:clathrin-coated vesicle protein [Vararia minispora EC-137]|uniref:Clathrin-coated vesicle protein n=1 Tax=Vararia minispora EC-137 TaxID=1314806 RepID=A0ACB8QGE9_9AGAM|nr:clathrin-coated vesicle protein [Vararia minispora EC-137]